MKAEITLNSEQTTYLAGLREGDASRSQFVVNNLQITPDLNAVYQNDAYAFSVFLSDNHHVDPPNEAMGMRIPKNQLIALLSYFNDNNCLLQTNCMGLTKSIQEGGQLVWISRGAFWQSTDDLPDEKVYGSFYIVKDEDGQTKYPAYLNFDLTNPIDDQTAKVYINHFLSIYSTLVDKQIHGYLFPIKAMLNCLNQEFETEIYLRLSWGLMGYLTIPGNVSLLIKADDTDRNPFVIEFRDSRINPTSSSCPPKQPCDPPSPPSQEQ